MQPLHYVWGTAISFKRNLGSKEPYLISCGMTALRLHLFAILWIGMYLACTNRIGNPPTPQTSTFRR